MQGNLMILTLVNVIKLCINYICHVRQAWLRLLIVRLNPFLDIYRRSKQALYNIENFLVGNVHFKVSLPL